MSDQDLNRGDWMQTYSGGVFWPLEPQPEDVEILDIAHALSNLCRYAGHTRCFYSVAHHSVLVSRIVPPKDAVWGLMHDAAEAYCIDLPRPIKHSPEAEGYRNIENRIMAAICRRFEMDPRQPDSVEEADLVMLATERRDLMAPPPRPWRRDGTPLVERIEPWSPLQAEIAFLSRAMELGIGSVEPKGDLSFRLSEYQRVGGGER